MLPALFAPCGLLASALCLACALAAHAAADVDVPRCIENFDIHKDKIIRTTDSRAMGAKYLNEMDLDSRDECLRLCCETDNCDVFVYEEKNAGSCYLFQCGPPEDFKCKFTHHVNYTSAINRHLLDLESQIKLTKHEQELTKLRKPDAAAAGGRVEALAAQRQAPTTPHTTSTTSKPATLAARTLHGQPEASTRASPDKKCSPYQFECRSTGECIAIYNACDGIPQCADGSDEGPELQCPDATTPSPPNGPQLPQQEMPAQRLPPPDTRYDVYRQRLPPTPPADFLRPAAGPLNPQQLAQMRYMVPQAGPPPNWGHPAAGPQAPPGLLAQHMGQYPSRNSHIFNHKETGLQVPDVAEPSQMQYAGADGRAEGQRLDNYYGGAAVYGQQFPQLPPMLENNWPAGNNQPASVADFRQNLMYPSQDLSPGRETWSPNLRSSTKIVKDLPQLIETKAIGKHEQEQIANDLKNSKQHFAIQASAPPPGDHAPTNGRHHQHEAEHEDDHRGSKYITEYKITSEALMAVEDGISETPSGAILSLTLGLILTALMGILIGCRLRVVRRRLRRGGKNYAHDADYLVNGMYL